MIETMTANLTVYLLVFARMAGMIGFNPLFNRRNVPAMVRTGLILMMTLLLAPNTPMGSLTVAGDLDLILLMAKELVIGLVCGFVFQLFYYMLFFVGDLMDVQFGMSMAKVFDPGTNIQMSLTGNMLSLLFMLYIFASDSHLVLIHIFANSFDILPLGGVVISTGIATHVLELFTGVFSLAMRLSVPFIAAEFIMEIAMGILMKLIPQIHVFVINIQFKMLLGIGLLLLFAGPIGSFVDNYMRLMFENIQSVLYAFA